MSILARKVWGVDSANPVTQELYECVKNKFGTPKFWGRYLTEIPNDSCALTKGEIDFLHSKEMKIMPIYNVRKESIGYEEAKLATRNAVFHARRLGIPENTLLFAQVEKTYKIDAEWIRGWIETMIPTGYRSGIYHDSLEGGFTEAYCKAIQENKELEKQVILWSATPEIGTTSERKSPKYTPAKPNGKANVWVWQYGRNSSKCSIATNLADERVQQFLF